MIDATSHEAPRQSRTHRSPDGAYAGVGAVGQRGGNLPIYICNACGREVVWAESARTGRKYLAGVAKGYHGQRFYIAANLHRCEDRPAKIDAANAALLDDFEDEAEVAYDDFAAAEYEQMIRTAYATSRVLVPDSLQQTAYYDYHTYTLDLPGANPARVHSALNRGIGATMYAYGSAGGYTSISGVTRDPETGLLNILSCYHIGD